MPNEVSCTITISGPPDKVKYVETFLRGLARNQTTEEEKDLLLGHPTQVKFFMVTAWKPPKFTFIQKSISVTTEEEDYMSDLMIRCAWTETGMLGYGWWLFSNNHLEKHRFFDVDLVEEDDGGVDLLFPTGEYAKFLKEEMIDG